MLDDSGTGESEFEFPYLGFAPQYGDGVSYSESSGLRAGLNHLKYNRVEVETVHEKIGGKYFVNEKATKNNFEEYASQAAILHLSMHGLFY